MTTSAAPGHPPADRTIRSFKRRRGRMSLAKQAALETLGPRWTVDVTTSPPSSAVDRRTGLLDQAAVYGRSSGRLVLDIGFGAGESTVALAARDPGLDVLGVEVHATGIAHLLRRTEREGLSNVRVVDADVWDVFPLIAPGALASVQVFFPDPWPKARHRARRLVGAPFVAAVAERLAEGGVLHVATDSDGYARQVLDVVAGDGRLALSAASTRRPGMNGPRPRARPETTYERRGLEAGRTVTDVVAARVPTDGLP